MPIVVAVLAGGCATDPIADAPIGPGYRPSNVYVAPGGIPAELRRLALLPVVTSLRGQLGEAGLEALGPALQLELAKAGRFELVQCPAGQLKQWTGQAGWGAEEKLPPDFFERLQSALGCEGVLFSRLTEYRPYPPMAVGWNLKLVDCRQKRIVWSVDEVFDAGNPAVENAARRFSLQETRELPPLRDSRTILLTPRRFGQYTAQAILGTLPPPPHAQVAPRSADNKKHNE